MMSKKFGGKIKIKIKNVSNLWMKIIDNVLRVNKIIRVR
jgi:hypothetical protein